MPEAWRGWPRGLGWRLTVARRWIVGRLAAGLVQGVARIRWLHFIPRQLMVPIERALVATRGEGLFDARHYLAENADVSAAGEDALMHYLFHGWAEGRAPNARFDDGYYRASSGLGISTPVSPLAHFIAFGQTLGLCPTPGVDLGALDRANPALAVARVGAYRRLVEGALSLPPDPRPSLGAALEALAEPLPRASDRPVVDVIIPVYLGRAETLNTLAHVLRARNETPAEIVVIDDATPDAALGKDLRGLAARGLITLLEQRQNRGFVAAVNLGMAAHPDRDVIWLNADTEVYDGWIDRLRRVALRRDRVATVTPLTNNGTICSYPRFNTDNPGALEIGWSALDRLAAEVNRGLTVETPTAVGFATYLRRAALEAVGMLDEAAFGLGYGEENDFSQRAIAAGWVNLIAADTFVRHFGATSFGAARAARVEAAMRVMEQRHPDYCRSVQRFLAADPVAPARRALDLARLRALAGTRNVLLVTHSLGGGTAQHVQEEIDRLTAQGWSVFLMSGGATKAGSGSTACISHASAAVMPGLGALALDGDLLWQTIAALGIERVDLHHLIDFGPAGPEIFRRRLAAAQIAFDVVVHDYYAVCPRINMVDTSGLYCGEPHLTGCQRCLIRRGARDGRVDIRAWRARHGALLAAARRIRVPDRDVAERLSRYLPALEGIDVVPHERHLQVAAPRPPAGRAPGPVRIVVLGAIGPIKGFDALLGLARHDRESGSRMAFTVIGYTRNDAAARSVGITVTGPYVNADVPGLIDAADPDLIWIPSLWPETYCYTLSLALASGRPVAAFDIGAQARRLRAAGRGSTLPLDHAMRPDRLGEDLLRAAGAEGPKVQAARRPAFASAGSSGSASQGRAR